MVNRPRVHHVRQHRLISYAEVWLDIVLFSIRCFPFRSGRRIRKTRKYDIITTPAERVEMAPLNDDNEDEDDSTLFDVKYRFGIK